MVNPVVGFRFSPTDEEIIDPFLRLKNREANTSYVDRVFSTVDIRNDPWKLPPQSRIETRDLVWYFFVIKENKYNRGERHSRKTSSGFWKKTGKTMEITRKRGGNREKIGEKRVLVFHLSKLLGGSKTKWVMHEYHATFVAPNQMATYMICKIAFKGEAREMSCYGSEVEHSHSLIPQFTGFLDMEQETQLGDAMGRAFENLSTDDWKSLLDDVDTVMNMYIFHCGYYHNIVFPIR